MLFIKILLSTDPNAQQIGGGGGMLILVRGLYLLTFALKAFLKVWWPDKQRAAGEHLAIKIFTE